jgi:isopenicillin-N epimerase
MPSPLAHHWTLDPGITFLNHGSFGACPRPVLDEQARLRAELERQPVEFMVRQLPGLLDAARGHLAEFLGADTAGLAFVPNATTGVNAVLRSLDFRPGDELLVTDHAYPACRNALDYVAGRTQARVVVARVPFPLASPATVVEALLAGLTARTRLVLLDHVTSPTGIIFPVADAIRALDARGIDTLVDGAHAPGMLPLRLDELGAAYYTGNCHKWLCAPKGAGFLHARADRREAVRPLTISHGATAPAASRSRFHAEFDWTGTGDPTPYLSVPAALDFMASLFPGGWTEVRARNRALALEARATLATALGVEPPCPDSMIGSLVALPLPDGSPDPPGTALYSDALQEQLVRRHGIEVPIVPWPAPPKRLLRVACQLYNEPAQYERLAAALGELLPRRCPTST